MDDKEVGIEEVDDNQTSDEICLSLRQKVHAIATTFLECESHFKTFYKRVLDDMDPIDEAKLTPIEPLTTWLKERELPDTITFQECFHALLMEHKQENRLLLSERAILLNDAARKLLGYKHAKKPIPLFRLIEKMAWLFE